MIIKFASSLMLLTAGFILGVRTKGAIVADRDVVGIAEVLCERVRLLVQTYIMAIRVRGRCGSFRGVH